MILVDTSVWVDYFNGRVTPETDELDNLLGREPLGPDRDYVPFVRHFGLRAVI